MTRSSASSVRRARLRSRQPGGTFRCPGNANIATFETREGRPRKKYKKQREACSSRGSRTGRTDSLALSHQSGGHVDLASIALRKGLTPKQAGKSHIRWELAVDLGSGYHCCRLAVFSCWRPPLSSLSPLALLPSVGRLGRSAVASTL
jgi:hypothetical protein